VGERGIKIFIMNEVVNRTLRMLLKLEEERNRELEEQEQSRQISHRKVIAGSETQKKRKEKT